MFSWEKMVTRHGLVTWAMLTIWCLEIRSKFIVFKNKRVHENCSELSDQLRQAEGARKPSLPISRTGSGCTSASTRLCNFGPYAIHQCKHGPRPTQVCTTSAQFHSGLFGCRGKPRPGKGSPEGDFTRLIKPCCFPPLSP